LLHCNNSEAAMDLTDMQPRIGSFQGCSPSGFHEVFYTDWGDPEAKRVIVCCHGLTRNGRDFDVLAARLASGIDFALASIEKAERQETVAAQPDTRGWLGARLADFFRHRPSKPVASDPASPPLALRPVPIRVICPDVVGRGRSEWLRDPANYGYPQYMSDMTALIARLGVPQVDWIGTSMGGLIGMFLASAPNAPIRSLVVNDVGPVLPRAALARIADYIGRDERFANLAEVEAHLRRVHAPFGPLTDEQWRHLARHGHRFHADGSYGLAYDPGIAVNVQLAVKDWDFWASWDSITCPALVLHGRQSDLLSEEVADAMSKRGPKAALASFDGIGHAPALMSTDQIETVAQWLARQA
jgi:pimeloyl-ACP methyl ester carboxylesterase